MKVKIVFFLVFAAIFSSPSHASEATLKAIVDGYAGSVKLGVAVHDIKTKSEIFNYNADKPLNPASVMKVITSSTALSLLGGSYEYKTELFTDRLTQGTAHNLYVHGAGDPSLVEERLWRIAKDLSIRGVKRVEGDIVIDNSYFEGDTFAGQESQANARAYNAKITALAVNFNSFAVTASTLSGIVDAHIDPPTDYFVFSHTIKSGGDSITIAREFKDGQEIVKASGAISLEKSKYANVIDPVQYAGTTLAWLLKQNGIEFNGKVRSGTASGKKLITDKSKPLCLILRDLNKFSNNFTAEMVLKTLAAENAGVPGTTENGAAILKSFLQKNGANPQEFEIHNGSGLSRDNKISARTFNQALLTAYKNNRIRSDFMASLAIAGTDGTLKNRLKSPNLIGNVKAKTGTLNDVSSLSGYLETSSGKMLAFTIIANGAGAGSGAYFGLQEKLLNALYAEY